MLNESTYYSATAAAQAIMGRGNPSISVDGKWGRFTQAAYVASSPDIRVAVDRTVTALTGTNVRALADYRAVQKSTGVQTGAAVSSDIKKLIASVANREGVPVDTVMRIVYLESRFNPNAVSPTGAKGLLQITGIAAKDVVQRGGGYQATNLFDPEQNLIVGLKYMKIVARDMGVRLDETAKLYMGFNIGPTGAKWVLSGQPEKAAKQISQQAYGPPKVYASNLAAAVSSAVV